MVAVGPGKRATTSMSAKRPRLARRGASSARQSSCSLARRSSWRRAASRRPGLSFITKPVLLKEAQLLRQEGEYAGGNAVADAVLVVSFILVNVVSIVLQVLMYNAIAG